MAFGNSFKRPTGIVGWLFLVGWFVLAIDWWSRVDFVVQKYRIFFPGGIAFPQWTRPMMDLIRGLPGQWIVLLTGLVLIAFASRRIPSSATLKPNTPLTTEENPVRISDSVLAAMGHAKLFYEQDDLNCYQPGGDVYLDIVGEPPIHYNERIFRIGINGGAEQARHCRLILDSVEPPPYDPGVHRLGLAMRPRIPQTGQSEEFVINPNAKTYVDVLQEIVRAQNHLSESPRIRLTYVNDDRGKANWFAKGNYVLTFRLEGAAIITPLQIRLGVDFVWRGQKQWHVRSIT